MRKIIVTTFVSLDGVLQAPGGPDPAGQVKTGLIGPDHPSEAELKRRKEWGKRVDKMVSILFSDRVRLEGNGAGGLVAF